MARSHARPRLLATAAALAVVATVVQGRAATAADGGATGRSDEVYTASTAQIANPERGFFHYSETHETPGGRRPLDPAELTRWRTTEGVTLVYRIHYLEAFRGTDVLAPDVLSSVAADLAAAREAGVKLVLRFAYSADDDQDAPAPRVVAHVRQLAPVLNAGADVVAVLQAGFVGRWGEWYYTRNFAGDPAQPWVVDDAHQATRDQVLDALVTNLDPRVHLQVRYPALARRTAAGPTASRIGLHDDCFLASADDFGTFPAPTDAAWLEQRSQTAPVGGETCAVAGARSAWASAATDLARFHWSFLNADYHPDVLASWGPAGLAEARKRLGYRLRLVRGSFPGPVTVGAGTWVSLTVRNDGYAAPFSSRPVLLQLVGPTGTTTVPVPLDVRALLPGRDVTVQVPLTAPTAAGSYALRLALPDASPSLSSRAEYSVQLADVGTWNPSTGTNDLHRSLTILPSAGGDVPLSTLRPLASSNGWGPYEVDRSNGEAAAGDGRRMSLRGTTSTTGLGVHSASDLEFAVPPATSLFRARVGVDDEAAGQGSVVFSVYVDGVLRYRSPTLTGRSAPQDVAVAVTGAARLRLTVGATADGAAHDHADWADARLTR
ncbi:DUF4832 domain-containing protein [Kineococcus rubinsiae]|uniref:DUF4832 domain-containing protein n=1 Tax=Kineococcus rubinsiae TaxID=2609562 RepID=UPI001430F948|nr:DUF4832 domain-containing protein [Kineococcus rubinsiae]NIZ92087.1 DUF4832 domain-containing protein [Kineococcus rubinsiae]